jgi:hypothetical protein
MLNRIDVDSTEPIARRMVLDLVHLSLCRQQVLQVATPATKHRKIPRLPQPISIDTRRHPGIDFPYFSVGPAEPAPVSG